MQQHLHHHQHQSQQSKSHDGVKHIQPSLFELSMIAQLYHKLLHQPMFNTNYLETIYLIIIIRSIYDMFFCEMCDLLQLFDGYNVNKTDNMKSYKC